MGIDLNFYISLGDPIDYIKSKRIIYYVYIFKIFKRKKSTLDLPKQSNVNINIVCTDKTSRKYSFSSSINSSIAEELEEDDKQIVSNKSSSYSIKETKQFFTINGRQPPAPINYDQYTNMTRLIIKSAADLAPCNIVDYIIGIAQPGISSSILAINETEIAQFSNTDIITDDDKNLVQFNYCVSKCSLHSSDFNDDCCDVPVSKKLINSNLFDVDLIDSINLKSVDSLKQMIRTNLFDLNEDCASDSVKTFQTDSSDTSSLENSQVDDGGSKKTQLNPFHSRENLYLTSPLNIIPLNTVEIYQSLTDYYNTENKHIKIVDDKSISSESILPEKISKEYTFVSDPNKTRVTDQINQIITKNVANKKLYEKALDFFRKHDPNYESTSSSTDSSIDNYYTMTKKLSEEESTSSGDSVHLDNETQTPVLSPTADATTDTDDAMLEEMIRRIKEYCADHQTTVDIPEIISMNSTELFHPSDGEISLNRRSFKTGFVETSTPVLLKQNTIDTCQSIDDEIFKLIQKKLAILREPSIRVKSSVAEIPYSVSVSSLPCSKITLNTDVEHCSTEEKATSYINIVPSTQDLFHRIQEHQTYSPTTKNHVKNLKHRKTPLLNHTNPVVAKKLQQIGINKLQNYSDPASCCRLAKINEPIDPVLPFSASLRSLPLDQHDLTQIEQATSVDKQPGVHFLLNDNKSTTKRAKIKLKSPTAIINSLFDRISYSDEILNQRKTNTNTRSVYYFVDRTKCERTSDINHNDVKNNQPVETLWAIGKIKCYPNRVKVFELIQSSKDKPLPLIDFVDSNKL